MPQIILNDDVFMHFYNILLQGIEKDCSEVACRQSEIICNLAKNVPQDVQSNIFSDKYLSLIEKMTEFMYRTDNDPVNGDVT